MSDGGAGVRPGPGVTYAVDAHHHLWDLDRHRHDWLDAPAHQPIRRSFNAADYRVAVTAGVGGLPVARSVLVQSLATAAETADLLDLVAGQDLVGAVVGWMDLHRPDVADELGALRARSAGPRLRGIRHLVQGESDPGWLSRQDTVRGLRAVSAAGLVYDLLVKPNQLPAAAAVAGLVPDLALVLDHAGKPDLTDPDPSGFAEWATGIRRLAAHPQVSCKLSGLITEAPWARWQPADLRPAVEVLLEAFGPSRLMFGSDWPVCLLAGTWSRWADTVELFLSELSPTERADVLGATATRVYAGPGLPVTEPATGSAPDPDPKAR